MSDLARMTADELRARTAEGIRARYVECLARATYEDVRSGTPEMYPTRWEELSGELRASFLAGEQMYVDALAAAGLLPVFADCMRAYQPDGTPLDHWRLQFLTAWRDVADYYVPGRPSIESENRFTATYERSDGRGGRRADELIEKARRQVGEIADKSMREQLIADLAEALETATANTESENRE